MRAEFYIEPTERRFKDGKPCDPYFEDVEMVKLFTAGDKSSAWVGKVTDQIKKDYKQEYAAFKEGVKVTPNGYPIQMWSPISAPQAKHLMNAGVLTVEELAAVSDDNLRSLGMGASKLRELAKTWLEEKSKNAPAELMAAKMAELKEQVERQTKIIETLQAQNEKLVAGVKPEEKESKPMPEIDASGGTDTGGQQDHNDI